METKKKRRGRPPKAQRPHVKRIKLERIANLYALYSSIPVALRQMNVETVKLMGYEEEYIELLKIRTMDEFAARYKVNRSQLVRWKNSVPFQKMVDDWNRKSNVMRFKKDVDHAFVRKTIREGDAPRVKLFKQLFEGFQEESKQDNVQHIIFEISDDRSKPNKIESDSETELGL